MTPVALSIAGSDCSAGAGIQADLKTFSAHRVHGLTAVTCVVSETPLVVSQIHPVPPIILQDQIRLLLDTYPVGAIKTGMLYSKAHIVAVTELLSDRSIPIVVDPVMVATSGSSLLGKDAIAAYKERLIPISSLITPNMPEASVLLGRNIETADQLEDAARELSDNFGTSCLLKGGHLPGNGQRMDALCTDGDTHTFTADMIDIESTHGTGCTLSAAITSNLAVGKSIKEAVELAKAWTHAAIADSYHWQSQQGSKVCSLNQLCHDHTV